MYIPPRRIDQTITEPYEDQREVNNAIKAVDELIDKTNKDVRIYYTDHMYDGVKDITEYRVGFIGTRRLFHYLKVFIKEFKRDNNIIIKPHFILIRQFIHNIKKEHECRKFDRSLRNKAN